jgi:hypothetical protein
VPFIHIHVQSRLDQWDAIFLLPLLFLVNDRFALDISPLIILGVICAINLVSLLVYSSRVCVELAELLGVNILKMKPGVKLVTPPAAKH